MCLLAATMIFILFSVFADFTESISKDNDLLSPENSSWKEDHLPLLVSNFEMSFKPEEDRLSNQSMCANITKLIDDKNITSFECEELLAHAPQFLPSTLTKAITLLAIAVLSAIGNIATLYSICKTRRQNTSTVYFLISHLAVSDLLVTAFCIFAEAVWTCTVQWYAGDAMCKLLKFFQMFALYLSTFILVVIGFDRMCAVRYPMRRMHARHQVRKGIVGVWAISALLSIPQLIIFRVKKGPFVEEFYQCVTYGFYTAQWQEQVYTSITLFLMFIIPLFTLIGTYICTFCSISNKDDLLSERIVRSPLDDVRHKIIKKAKQKSLMITVVIVFAFIICWTPYYVMMIIFMFLDPNEQLGEELQAAIFFFGSSTAMINPLIYGAFHLRKTKSIRSTILKTSSSSANSSRLDTNSVLLMNSTLRKNKAHVKSTREEVGPFLESPNGETKTINGYAYFPEYLQSKETSII